MKLIGIETSCDETAAAVVVDGAHVASNIVASQIDIHAAYGGVVPEIAARSHIEVILPTIHQALSVAELDWPEIDGIAVTVGPGLLGSLLIGTLTARALAVTHRKPVYAVNHVVAHTFANMCIEQRPSFPLLSLSVSGGHSHMLYFKSPLDYQLVGRTRDDAAGEAFDKVAKMLGLPYPGGPSITKAALAGNEYAFKLPKARLAGSLDFSFSGLKTAVLRTLQASVGRDHTLPSSQLPSLLSETQVADMAASFQRTICETLVDRMLEAADRLKPASVVIAGGVAANTRLRREVSARIPYEMQYAPMSLCTDNAAMIASMGFYLAQAGQTTDPLVLRTDPSLPVRP